MTALQIIIFFVVALAVNLIVFFVGHRVGKHTKKYIGTLIVLNDSDTGQEILFVELNDKDTIHNLINNEIVHFQVKRKNHS